MPILQVNNIFQDGVKAGIEELIDNGLHAVLGGGPNARGRFTAIDPEWHPQIWVKFIEHQNDESKSMLVIQDNGVSGSRG